MSRRNKSLRRMRLPSLMREVAQLRAWSFWSFLSDKARADLRFGIVPRWMLKANRDFGIPYPDITQDGQQRQLLIAALLQRLRAEGGRRCRR